MSMMKYLFRVTEPTKRGEMIFYSTQYASSIEVASVQMSSRYGPKATWELKSEEVVEASPSLPYASSSFPTPGSDR